MKKNNNTQLKNVKNSLLTIVFNNYEGYTGCHWKDDKHNDYKF